ncbi:MAG: DNA polymerase III subunit gamma/tau [Treponema sp.]|nr:DNA polymerase III subunit gamma/tau [Treponema sp.]
MAYEVTATRRRPQRFDDLIGQEFVANTLKNSIKSGKIAHAYLFSGPRGCGKTSSARILAKSLNCEKGPTETPCGECDACREIAKGTSLDVIEIDGASNTSVNDIRQIKDEVLFPPNKCKYKIYIIDEVHMLTTNAFNALLKTIEEPPSYVIFIFATTELQKVPATIKSRCQQYNFHLVAIEKLKNLLADAAKEIGIQADDEALYWIARESTGSVRDAYTLFDQVVAFSDGNMTYDKIKDKLGLMGIDQLNNLFESCIDGNSGETLTKLDNILQNGVSIEQLISTSADYVRSMLLIKSGITKEALIGQSVERYSEKVLNSWNQIHIEKALSLFMQLYRDIRYSLSPRYDLELTFSKLCYLKETVSTIELKASIEAARKLLMQGAAIPNSPQNQNIAATNRQFSSLESIKAHLIQNEIKQDKQEVQHTVAVNNNVIPSFDSLKKVEEIRASANKIESSNNTFKENIAVAKQESISQENVVPVVPTEKTLDELQHLVIDELKVTEAMMASALMETENWQRKGNCITAETSNTYHLFQVFFLF